MAVKPGGKWASRARFAGGQVLKGALNAVGGVLVYALVVTLVVKVLRPDQGRAIRQAIVWRTPTMQATELQRDAAPPPIK